MDDKPSAVKAAEMRRRRILGSESNRMEKLTGNKQTPPTTYPSINFGLGDLDFDSLKKTLPMIKLRIKCSMQLLLLLFTSLLGITARLCQSENKNIILRLFKNIVNLFLIIPPLPLLTNIWSTNDYFRIKTVKIVTWSMLILFIMIKAQPPPSNAPNSSGEEANPNPEIIQIPKEIKDSLSNIGQWTSALLLFFFAGYDLAHNFFV